MKRLKLFYPNLDFEDELASKRGKATQGTQQAMQDLSALMAFLGDNGDAVIVPHSVPLPVVLAARGLRAIDSTSIPEGCEDYEFDPWGWSESAMKFARQAGIKSSSAPPIEAVKLVNRRSFNAPFDIVVPPDPGKSVGLQSAAITTFGTFCNNITDVRDAVSCFVNDGHDRWVAKPEHSHAGRNRLLATGVHFNDQQHGWFKRQFQHSGGVYVEPWVERLDEIGLQYEIYKDRDAELVGSAGLLNDAMGRYIGSVVHHQRQTAPIWQAVVDHGYSVCLAASRAGYFGPLGIDAFRFKTANGDLMLRACNDINARYTMGRIAVSMRKLLHSGESGVWIHGKSDRICAIRSAVEDSPGQSRFGDVRAVMTSPEVAEKRPMQSATMLVIGNNADQLRQLVGA